MVTVIFLSSLLGAVDVALKIDADRSNRSALAGLAAPHTVVVLLQLGDVGVAGILDFRLGLSFGEAVAARDRSVGIILTGAVDRVVVRSRLRRWILRRGGGGRQQSDTNEKK